jgi:hypothetical protein
MNMKVQTPAIPTLDLTTTTATPAAPPSEGRGQKKSRLDGGMPGGPPAGRPPSPRVATASGGAGAPPPSPTSIMGSGAGAPPPPGDHHGDPTAALMKTMEQSNLSQAKMQVMQTQMMTEGSIRAAGMETMRQNIKLAKEALSDVGKAGEKAP